MAVPPFEAFSYVYLVQYDSSTNTLQAVGDDLSGPFFSDVVTDNIANGSGDNPGILGDVFNDTFTATIGLQSVTAQYVGLASNSYNSSSGFLALYNGNYFYLTNQPVTDQGGDHGNLTFQLQEDVICFMRGTMVRTPEGELPVETLKSGDLVTTTDGRTVPVRWIGRQTISTKFADPLRVAPIRIKAGALGQTIPARDLLLSPDHAILLDGVLVQAGALVNGTSIVRESNVPEVFTYYHVEVDDHSLILAENVPAETFIDNVDRFAFDNWNEHEALYPEGKAIVEMPYPRAKAYRQVPRTIYETLVARGLALYGTNVSSAA